MAGIEDGEDAEADEDEEEGETKTKKETIFVAGRLYREDIEIKGEPEVASEPVAEGEAPKVPESEYKTKWIYERWNKVITSADYPDLPGAMAKLLLQSRTEVDQHKSRVREAREAVLKAAEEKKAALAAAAAKKLATANLICTSVLW